MKNKGFLLIEILIAVLIIAILTSIMLPRYKNAIKKAKSAELNLAVDPNNQNNGINALIGKDGNIDIPKIQKQINNYGNLSSVNKQFDAYEDKKTSKSTEGSIMIKFED